MQVDPRHLRILLAICRCGSFTAAAEALSISQPAVSAAIGQLERAWGVRLFERGRQGAIVTRAGQIAARRAEAIEQLLIATEQEVRLAREAIQGPLLVGGTPGALLSLLPPAVSILRGEAYRVFLQVTEASDAELIHMLRAGKIDIALCAVSVEAAPDDIDEQVVVEDRMVVISRRPDIVAKGEKASLADLAARDWIVPDSRGAFRRQIEAIFVRAELPMPANVIRCDALATTKEIIRQTDCITVLPWRVVKSDVEGGNLHAFDFRPAPPKRKMGFKMLKTRFVPPVVDHFVRCLFESAAED